MVFSGIPVRIESLSSLEEVQTLITQHKNLSENVEKEGWPSNDLLKKEWQTFELNNVNEISIKSIDINGTSLRYIHLQALVERAKRKHLDSFGNLLERKDRINPAQAEVLFFENNENIYMIVYLNMAKNNTKLNYILKDLLKEEYWGSVSVLPSDIHFSDDIYYWMLFKIMSNQKNISNSPVMELKTFTGFTGAINDTNKDHSMVGEGERISALLSTLAFIFGDDSLKSLKLEVCIDSIDSYLFELSHQGNIVLYEHNYNGQLNVADYNELQVFQTLVIYKLILPIIFNAFEDAKVSGSWSLEIKREFLQTVGQQIIDRVSATLAPSETDCDTSTSA